MSNFMFVVPPYYGHITATLGIGSELISRGHKVCWVSLREIDKGFIPEGAQWLVPDEVKARQNDIDRILDRQNIGTVLNDEETLDFILYESLFPFAEILNSGIQGVIDSFKPDAIIQDESALSGAVAAVRNNIPYATSITVPPGFFEKDLFNPVSQKKMLDKVRIAQKGMGIESERIIFNSDKLVLSFTSADLLRPRYRDFEFDAPIAFVGAAILGRPEPNQFDWGRVKNRDLPIIYISIGTLLDDTREIIFKLMVDAFANRPFTIIANTDPSLLDRWPGNFIVQKMFPQLEILSKVDLVITHAGFNTLNEALYFDLPLIALPLAWDQGVNAELVTHHGCGLKFDYRTLAPSELLDAATEVLGQPEYRKNAASLGESLRRGGGTKRAADLIEQLANHTDAIPASHREFHPEAP